MKKILLPLLFLTQIFGLRAQSPELRIPTVNDGLNEHFFYKEDKMLITLGKSEVKIWDLSGPFLVKSLKWPGLDTLFKKKVFITKDQRRAVVYATGNVRFINLATADWEKARFKVADFDNAMLSRDEKSLFFIDFDGNGHNHSFHKFDLSTGKSVKINTFDDTDNDEPYGYGITLGAEVSPDGSRILTGGNDRSGLVFDVGTGKILKKFRNPLPLFFLENGNLIACTYLDYDPNSVGKPNPRYQIEEFDGKTFNSVRKANLTYRTDDIDSDNKIMFIRHDHRNRVLLHAGGTFCIFDVKKWAFSARQNIEGNSGLEGLSDGGKFGYFGNRLFSTESGKFVKQFGFESYQPFNLAQANIGEDRGILAGYEHLHFDKKGFRVNILPVLEGCEDFNWLQRSIYRVLPNQKKLLMTGGTEYPDNYVLKSYTLGTDTSLVTTVNGIDGYPQTIMEMRPYDDNGTVVATGTYLLSVFDQKTWKLKQQIGYEDEYTIAHFDREDESFILERSPDRTRVIVHLKKDDGAESHRIACFDLIQKRMAWAYDERNPLSNAIFAESGKQVWVVNEGGVLIKLDAQNGKVISKSAKIPYASNASRFSTTGKYLITLFNTEESGYNSSQINVIETANLQLKCAIKQNLACTGFMTFDDDRFLITQDEDIKVRDLATGKLLARIILIKGTNDWIVATEDGRFDGSPGGLKKMCYVKGLESIPLEQLYDGFFTPNLLTEAMYGGGAKSSAPVDINQLKLPPTVRIVNKALGMRNLDVTDDDVPNYESTQRAIMLTVDADAKGDKISEVRLYQNGKLLNQGTRSFKPVTEGAGTGQQDFEVTLSPGENRFKAVAINSQRTESAPAIVAIQYKATVEEKKQAPGITLHLVVVGINQYKNSKYNLNYAEADALGFKDELKKNCGKLETNCQEYYVTNDKAVKEGIVTALEKVVATAKPEDVFLFYYAGHGVVSEANEFFLVPHDVTQIYGNDGSLAQKGISATDLRAFSTKIKAQKQLFILDACHSSGALNTVAQRGAAEEKAISQLARSTGTHWLTAAGSDQYASEFTQLGHGVFTYVLLEGFKGAADVNGDGKITVKEIDAYLQDQVPILTEKYKGTAQYPSSYGFGQDFPVGLKH